MKCSYCEERDIGVMGPHSHVCSVCGGTATYGWYTTPLCETCKNNRRPTVIIIDDTGEPVDDPTVRARLIQWFNKIQELSVEHKAWEKEGFATIINQCAKDIHTWARGKGFWEIPDPLFSLMAKSSEVFKFVDDLVRVRKMALITTETSEAVEGIRKPVEASIPGFDNDTEEQADQIIRILDYCGSRGLPIGECIAAKMAKNEGRPYMHGKAF